MICQTCQDMGKKTVYIGESHRTWGDRAGDHAKALKDMDQAYATVTNHLEHHRDQKEPRFLLKLDKSHTFSFQRQVKEALLIQEETCDILLNKRGEWGKNSLPENTIYDERKEPPVHRKTRGKKGAKLEVEQLVDRHQERGRQNGRQVGKQIPLLIN